MTTEAEHWSYFERQFDSNQEYWRRFGRAPEVEGKAVLDLGCGHGAMSFDLARKGAARVHGVDMNGELIEFAHRAQEQRFPDTAGKVTFGTTEVAALEPDAQFDLVVSKDTFEHISDVEAVCRDLHRLLRPGGELWTGFSPLYFSPNGDHHRTGLPTGLHSVLPQRLVLRYATKHTGRPIRSLDDLGLNGLTPKAFRARIGAAGFEPVSVAYNQGDKPMLRALTALRRVKALEAHATVSVYAVFRAV